MPPSIPTSRMTLFLAAVLFLFASVGCNERPPRPPASAGSAIDTLREPEDTGRVVIFHAGSLAIPFRRLARLYEKTYPGSKVLLEASGSRIAARKITELGRRADILASADHRVIQNLVLGKYADWLCCFARNEMVIAFTAQSKFANEIDEKNWFEILTRKEVRFGHSDPNKDPCGYRTRIVWRLADLHYKRKIGTKSIYQALKDTCPPAQIRPGSTELLPLLQSMALDYAWEYRSVAEQHRLRYLRLPAAINLGDPARAALYELGRESVTGKTPGAPPIVQRGTPIVYALTVPRNAPNRLGARRFAELLLGPKGAAIFEGDHQTVIPGGRMAFLRTSRITLDNEGSRP